MSVQHGHCRRGANTSTYMVWQSMKKRCLNKKCISYVNYGGRGITICDRWIASYESFLADMGERPKGKSLERRDNNLGYSLENCYWASRSAQARNTRQNVMLTLHGETKCRRDWELSLKLSDGAIWHRLKMGWTLERALTTPARGKIV